MILPQKHLLSQFYNRYTQILNSLYDVCGGVKSALNFRVCRQIPQLNIVEWYSTLLQLDSCYVLIFIGMKTSTDVCR